MPWLPSGGIGDLRLFFTYTNNTGIFPYGGVHAFINFEGSLKQ